MASQYTFISCGTVDDVLYVDVLLPSDDPLEYGIPLFEAQARYGDAPVISISEWAGAGQ